MHSLSVICHECADSALKMPFHTLSELQYLIIMAAIPEFYKVSSNTYEEWGMFVIIRIDILIDVQ